MEREARAGYEAMEREAESQLEGASLASALDQVVQSEFKHPGNWSVSFPYSKCNLFQCYVDFREAWQMDWVVASLQREAARKRTMALLKFVGVGSGEAACQHPELLGAFMAGGISDPAVLFCSKFEVSYDLENCS